MRRYSTAFRMKLVKSVLVCVPRWGPWVVLPRYPLWFSTPLPICFCTCSELEFSVTVHVMWTRLLSSDLLTDPRRDYFHHHKSTRRCVMMLLGDINQPSLLISTALTVSARERRRDTRADTDGRLCVGSCWPIRVDITQRFSQRGDSTAVI